jgi:hypothetical protein
MKTGDIYLTAFLFAIGVAIYLVKSVQPKIKAHGMS